MSNPDAAASQLVELLRAATRILVFTGAGISTGSGIPDFRGPQGVWKTRRPVDYRDFLRSEAARVEHWDFKLDSWPRFRDARPTPAHTAIADLETAGKVRLVEIHGTNAEVECLTCRQRSDPEPHMQAFARTRVPPRCPCGGLLKSATISFGQELVAADLERATRGAAACDLVVALGSTLSVYPAAALPSTATARGTPYVIINRGATEHDGRADVTLRLEGDVQRLLPPAVAAALARGA